MDSFGRTIFSKVQFFDRTVNFWSIILDKTLIMPLATPVSCQNYFCFETEKFALFEKYSFQNYSRKLTLHFEWKDRTRFWFHTLYFAGSNTNHFYYVLRPDPWCPAKGYQKYPITRVNVFIQVKNNSVYKTNLLHH